MPYISTNVTGAPSHMLFVRVNKRVNLVTIRRWRFIMPVLAVVEVSLLAKAETSLAGHFAISKLIDVITVRLGSKKAFSLTERVLIFGR